MKDGITKTTQKNCYMNFYDFLKLVLKTVTKTKSRDKQKDTQKTCFLISYV